MTIWTLIIRSLRFHARSHLGALLGAAIGSAVLIGALIVGDSVRGSLREMALQRLGKINCALQGGDRVFRADLAERIDDIEEIRRRTYVESTMSPILILPAIASREDGTARANRVQLLGVETNLVELGADPGLAAFPPGTLAVNESLANHLHVKAGDTLVLRARKPSALSLEAPISPQSDSSFVLRLKIHKIVPATALGNFNLTANQVPPFNVFVPMEVLQKAAHIEKKANIVVGHIQISWSDYALPRFPRLHLLLKQFRSHGEEEEEFESGIAPAGREELNETFLSRTWDLRDAQIELKPTRDNQQLEMRSERIFIDESIARAALSTTNFSLKEVDYGNVEEIETNRALAMQLTNAQPILTYFVNQLRSGNHTTPYSMVTAAGPPLVPADLHDDEIVINQWLADDLQASVGSTIDLTFFLPESAGKLIEQTNRFRVRGIVPLSGIHADQTLMPEFPGIAQAEKTENWDAGFPLVHKIRPKDEQYWKEHRGTPKAFISLATGQKLWGNRFGNLTAIRFPLLRSIGESNRAGMTAEILEKKILGQVRPDEVGLRFEPAREQALAAANQSEDFGGLFLGFSFFLIIAAVLLMALMFQFGLEQRASEIGTLLALGLGPKKVRRILLLEGAVVSLAGGIIGAVGGILFARGMLHALTTVWRSAVGTSSLQFYATTPTLSTGFAASFVLSTLTVWWVLRKQARQPARELLNEGAISSPGLTKRKMQWSKWIALICGGGAMALLGYAISQKDSNSAETFFSAGMLLLVAVIAGAAWLLRKWSTSSEFNRISSTALAVRNASRRKNRSLATIALLASGSFLIASIGAFKLSSDEKAEQRSSGTGGFALIGETTLPVIQNLNEQTGREFFGLNEGDLKGVSFVPFRVREGDDASCLNLNRAQRPRLLGVNPKELEARQAFTFARTIAEKGSHGSWQLLSNQKTSDEVPAIGDEASITWALHKKVGDTIDYTDDRGNSFKIRIVGTIANSILQGSLIIDENAFRAKFPNETGARLFFIEAPHDKFTQVAKELSRGLQDVGFEVTPARERLAAFNAVQNTYLNTFQILGGLGLLLGTVGLAVVVLRNVFERRSELALLLALGFTKRSLRHLVISEHAALLLVGLLFGIVSAFLAILPQLLSPRGEIPYASLGVTLGAIAISGLLWTWLATQLALRGELLKALRNE